jgi:CheY-like chemotaxis protein
MTPTEPRAAPRILLVDDDGAVRAMVNEGLQRKGCEVVTACSVTEALARITTQNFDVLITDLHMPDPGDGFTVVSAMRHAQPNALTMLVSGYPDVQSAMAAILLEADEIVVKPFEIGRLIELVSQGMVNRKPTRRPDKERVGVILQRCVDTVVAAWLGRVKRSDLRSLPLSDEERTGHLPKLVEDLALRLSQPTVISEHSDAIFSAAAAAHGKVRYQQGYTPSMLVQESRLLQVTIFETLQNNLNSLDFSLLLPDVMTIADEVDAQLTQSMDSYMKLMQRSMAA